MYDVIYADPPWHFKTYSPKGQGRSPKYHTMSLQEIVDLPVAGITNDNAVLFLWTLGWIPLETIAALFESWGFVYKTVAFDWWKKVKDGSRPRIAKGYYTRSTNEWCLLGVKGNMPVPPSQRPQMAIEAPVEAHSAKPVEAYENIELMYPDAKKVELFARNLRPGWYSIGNEIDGMDIRTKLNRMIEEWTQLKQINNT